MRWTTSRNLATTPRPPAGRAAPGLPPSRGLAGGTGGSALGVGCLLVAAVAGTVISGAGCAGDGPKVSLKSDDVAGRIPAMKLAAGRHDPKAAPDLVESLSSDDPAERMFAIRALNEITGRTFGYHYFDDDDARAPAVQRWKDWLNPEAASRPGAATRPIETRPAAR